MITQRITALCILIGATVLGYALFTSVGPTATGTFAAPSAGTIEFAYGITSSATAGLGVTVIDHSIAIEATFWK